MLNLRNPWCLLPQTFMGGPFRMHPNQPHEPALEVLYGGICKDAAQRMRLAAVLDPENRTGLDLRIAVCPSDSPGSWNTTAFRLAAGENEIQLELPPESRIDMRFTISTAAGAANNAYGAVNFSAPRWS